MYGEFYAQKYAEDDCSIATADESNQRYPSGPIPAHFQQTYLLYLLWVILYRVLYRCITALFGQILSKTFFAYFWFGGALLSVSFFFISFLRQQMEQLCKMCFKECAVAYAGILRRGPMLPKNFRNKGFRQGGLSQTGSGGFTPSRWANFCFFHQKLRLIVIISD